MIALIPITKAGWFN